MGFIFFSKLDFRGETFLTYVYLEERYLQAASCRFVLALSSY